jgi:hypothetical protein
LKLRLFILRVKEKQIIFINGICGNDISDQFSLSIEGEICLKGEVTQKKLYEVYEDEINK